MQAPSDPNRDMLHVCGEADLQSVSQAKMTRGQGHDCASDADWRLWEDLGDLSPCRHLLDCEALEVHIHTEREDDDLQYGGRKGESSREREVTDDETLRRCQE